MQRQVLRQFREVGAQDFFRFLHNEVAPRAGGHAAQHEQMAEFIQVRVMRQRVAEIDTNGFKNLRRTRVALFVQILNELELVGGLSQRQFDPRRRRQSHDRLLRKILHAAAGVPGPFVGWSARVEVNRSEGEFVEPAGDAALGVQETRRLARTHRDAQHGACLQRHRASERSHVAVVGDFQWHTPFLTQVEEQWPDFPRERLRRHPAEERRDHHFVINVNARRTAADGVHPWQMFRRELQAIVDFPVMPVGVGLNARVPGNFRREYRFTVVHRGELVIARSQVEADPAAVQMPAQRHGRFAGDRRLPVVNSLYHERLFVNLLHQFHVERPCATARIDLRDVIANFT